MYRNSSHIIEISTEDGKFLDNLGTSWGLYHAYRHHRGYFTGMRQRYFSNTVNPTKQMGESIMQIYEQLVIYAQQDRANPSVYLFMGYRKNVCKPPTKS